MNEPTLDWYLEAVRGSQRRGLAKALTLMESTLPAHRQLAGELLQALGPPPLSTLRIGLSGVPGVGKSTFLDKFGMLLIERGHKAAVLSIDPTSPLSGGSILGDKTRMPVFSAHEHAFVRPSPAGGALGGVAWRTQECLRLMEAAGYDVVIVETVGVGQSEVDVAGMTDFFLMLCLAGAGDELQGVKKGILELVDCAVINKVDQVGLEAANRAKAELQSALRLGAPSGAVHGGMDDWQAPVLLASGLTGDGLPAIAETIFAFNAHLTSRGLKAPNRRRQDEHWFNRALSHTLLDALMARPNIQPLIQSLRDQVSAGVLPPSLAAEQAVTQILAASP